MRAWIATFFIALAALALAPTALGDAGDSSNWSGYAVHGASFHRVLGNWRQPGVACVPGHETYSAYWVGLGGYSGSALEQIGTEADCSRDGRPILSAWYELVPAGSVPIALHVAPGDQIAAQVTVDGHRVTLSLRDRTRHRGFRTTVYAPQIDVSSAEWIVEAPSDCVGSCLTLPLANFGSTVFTSARAQGLTGHAGAISDPAWKATAIALRPTGAAASASSARASGAALPSALSGGGSSFRVAYAQVSLPQLAFARRRAAGRAGHLVPGARRLAHR